MKNPPLAALGIVATVACAFLSFYHQWFGLQFMVKPYLCMGVMCFLIFVLAARPTSDKEELYDEDADPRD